MKEPVQVAAEIMLKLMADGVLDREEVMGLVLVVIGREANAEGDQKLGYAGSPGLPFVTVSEVCTTTAANAARQAALASGKGEPPVTVH